MAVITISRQYGSGGDDIAFRVCDVLGYRYFDKRLLSQMISQEHLTPQQIVDYHEDAYKVRSFLDKLRGYRPCPPSLRPMKDKSFMRAAEATDQVGENMMIWLADAAIRAAYEEGNMVIVGRGGQVVLHDKPGVLHVRIEAPLEERIGRVAAGEEVSPSKARQIVGEHDSSAADYLKRFYGTNWSDPLLYHLVINTGRVSMEAGVKLIIEAVHLVAESRAPEPEAIPA